MNKQDFERISHSQADNAWNQAILYELLASFYNSLAAGRFDDFQDTLKKLNQLSPEREDVDRVIQITERLINDVAIGDEAEVLSTLYQALNYDPNDYEDGD